MQSDRAMEREIGTCHWRVACSKKGKFSSTDGKKNFNVAAACETSTLILSSMDTADAELSSSDDDIKFSRCISLVF